MDNRIEPKSSKNSVVKNKDKKVTHLYLNDKYLKKIPKFSEPQNLSVLYLHNNEISEIANLENAVNLTSLYLQKNMVLEIANLTALRRLKKLYLGHNSISVVEGLENLSQLEQLHLEKQYLSEGNCLCFDPRSIFSISGSLRILDISHNKIQSIACLISLKFLMKLDASHNDISDVDEVCDILKNWYYLNDVSFAQNPIARERLYKEDIISSAYCLEILDGKEISDSNRNFFKRLNRERVSQKLVKRTNLADRIDDLPRNYPTSVQKAVSAIVLRQNKDLFNGDSEIFNEKNAVYIPWKTLPRPHIAPKLRMLAKKRGKLPKKSTPLSQRMSQLNI